MVALPQGRAPLGALTPAYSRTPPFPSWGRSCAGAQAGLPLRNGRSAAGLGQLTSLRARSCRYVKWLGPPVRSSLTLKSPPQWYALLLLVAASCCGFPQPADNSSADCHLAGVGPDAYSVRENFLVSFSTYYLYSSTTTYPPAITGSSAFPPFPTRFAPLHGGIPLMFYFFSNGQFLYWL